METVTPQYQAAMSSITSTKTKTDELTHRLITEIEKGLYAPGSKLRSVRDAAKKEAVGINTVLEAYNRLSARGYVEARPGSGFYIRSGQSTWTQAPAPHVSAAIDVVSLLREQLEQHYEVRVGDGRPPASWIEDSEIGRQLRRSRADERDDMGHGYGTPWGYQPLRETIARLLAERGIQSDSRQILLTQGANHALDLIIRHLLSPGEKVLVDSPGYYPLFGKLKLAKVDMLGVPRLEDGPDLSVLHELLKTERPRLFFTQSLAHNPTGNSISLSKAHKLLQMTAEHGCLVVEDDPFADLHPPTAPRLAALDQLERVIYVSSFSKTLSAGLRVGYVAGAAHLISDLCDLKMLTMVSTSDYVERVVFQMVSAGHYRRHVQKLKNRLQELHPAAVKSLRRAGATVRSSDPGGYYIWLELPKDVDELALIQNAAAAGIFLAPGSVFYPTRTAHLPALRINVAYASDPKFLRFIEKALR
jgi:DNA-binding transcriptional MocR family regulator